MHECNCSMAVFSTFFFLAFHVSLSWKKKVSFFGKLFIWIMLFFISKEDLGGYPTNKTWIYLFHISTCNAAWFRTTWSRLVTCHLKNFCFYLATFTTEQIYHSSIDPSFSVPSRLHPSKLQPGQKFAKSFENFPSARIDFDFRVASSASFFIEFM